MRIAMIGHKRVPSREGGIEIVVEELSKRLSEAGHAVTIYNRRKRGFPKIKEYHGCKIKTVFTINTKSFDAIVYSFFATIRALFSRNKVLHFHALGPCLFLWLLRFSRKKIVVTVHGLDWQNDKWKGFAAKVIRFGEKQAVRHADEIITISRNNQNYFLEKYNRETTYIPNGINPPHFREPHLIKESFGLGKMGYIFFLARIDPVKGVHYLVDAWQGLTETDRGGLKLVISGGSQYKDDYFHSVMKKIEGDVSIVFTGFVEGRIFEELHSNAYLYVLPSDKEGMPVSLLEAMSFGNTCLVSDIPPNTEIINENCYTFERGNVNDLRRMLKDLIAMEFDKHHEIYLPFSWDDVTQSTIDLYERKRFK